MPRTKLAIPATRRSATLALGLAIALAGGAVAAYVSLTPAEAGRSEVGTYVSQASRTFSPDVVTMAAGKPLTIVNDDGRTVHHAYVDTEGFSYDSGDQDPGDKAVITFPAAGAFQVMCGIHPKMRMTVIVK